jgi:hypothetical protein
MSNYIDYIDVYSIVNMSMAYYIMVSFSVQYHIIFACFMSHHRIYQKEHMSLYSSKKIYTQYIM